MPSIGTLAAFLLCVVTASLAQNLSGFALGLVLLGLVELLHLVPLADAANAAMVLSLASATAFFHADRRPPPWREVNPILGSGLVGVAIGVFLLAWLSANAVQWLRLLLGVTVVGSAVILFLHRHPLPQPSSRASFAGIGLVSGVLGGLFATSGPPLVFHLYRQPMDPAVVRRCLFLVFAVYNVLRLVLVTATGQFSRLSLLLCAVAVPVVFAVTHVLTLHPPRLPRRALGMGVAGLLALTGLSLMAKALAALTGG
jgi:uncharacterized membrane protein YfcA